MAPPLTFTMFGTQSQFLNYCQSLHRESLIQFDQSDILEFPIQPF